MYKDEVALKTAIMSFINVMLKYGSGQVSVENSQTMFVLLLLYFFLTGLNMYAFHTQMFIKLLFIFVDIIFSSFTNIRYLLQNHYMKMVCLQNIYFTCITYHKPDNIYNIHASLLRCLLLAIGML